MILRFFSGSDTPASFDRNSSDASARCRSMPAAVRRSITSFASFRRSTPLSTSTAWKRLPMARFISTAATLESTPPLTAPITCSSSPTCLRIASMASFTKEPISQSLFAWQMPHTKFFSRMRPWGVCVTSGWNWMPYITCSREAMAACSAFFVAPMS